MEGGGVMRAAAKAAGLGLQNAGVRGGLPENFASARNAFRQSASALSSTTASVDDTTSRIEFTTVSPTAQPLNWELDDWEFDGYGLEEQPRLVFGPAHTLEETKEATSELRDALDKGNIEDDLSKLQCKSSVPMALIDMHSCSLEAKIKMNLGTKLLRRLLRLRRSQLRPRRTQQKGRSQKPI